ncbi:MAG: DUF3179 domain-containing protein [Acidobacteria bacterium]|nr:DUF3179 domain-containing protein [Acidobacteriota bacterium]
MWESQVDGRKLTFHLAGINNQNFIMRDEETGSWWQQVSGEALHGPLKGKRLTQVYNDEISFAVFKREHPQGRVLRPDEKVQAKYEAANWEEEYAKFPVVTPMKADDKIAPRTLMAGIVVNGKAMAYPVNDLQKQRLILDNVGGQPIFVVMSDDDKSVRAFESTVDGRKLELLVQAEAKPLQLVDAETATTWDFSGAAVSGALAGKQLTRIQVLKDYWFDWKIYHPDTAVYALGAR